MGLLLLPFPSTLRLDTLILLWLRLYTNLRGDGDVDVVGELVGNDGDADGGEVAVSCGWVISLNCLEGGGVVVFSCCTGDVEPTIVAEIVLIGVSASIGDSLVDVVGDVTSSPSSLASLSSSFP